MEEDNRELISVGRIIKVISNNFKFIIYTVSIIMALSLIVNLLLPQRYLVQQTFIINPRDQVQSSFSQFSMFLNQNNNALERNIDIIVNSKLFYKSIAKSVESYFSDLDEDQIIAELKLNKGLEIKSSTTPGLYVVSFSYTSNEIAKKIVDNSLKTLGSIFYAKELTSHRNNFIIIDEAEIPDNYTYPKIKRNLIIVMFTSLLLSMSIAIFRNIRLY